MYLFVLFRMVCSSSQCTAINKSVLEKISSYTLGLSTNIFHVEEPKNNFNAATFLESTFNISSKLSLVPPNMKE